ncbi:arsenic resistance operon repressor [Sporomusaceae bacterium FL31]|nr:arsenic resistance operon repressor [Sporomusaceae bacterium FL31]GCE34933.1 arsenic resistance operon repressor [Sporomusaceae bacterium]
MRKIEIYDPAMCCSTGICGPSIDQELLRVATVMNSLAKRGVFITRYNLSSDPQAFIDNKKVNEYLIKEEVEVLPITLVDGEVVKTRAYPTDDEFAQWTGLAKSEFTAASESKGCGCCDGGCC